MPYYSSGFKFDQGSLGRNLALLDDRVRDFVDRDIDEHTVKGEAALKTRAPWTDNTGHARRTLWAENDKGQRRYSITMGHGAEYGIYLERSNDGRFQVVMPVLLDTARSFMRSLEHMFAQLETHAPIGPAIAPGSGTRPGTSQRARDRLRLTEDRRGRIQGRNVKGQFASIKKFVSTSITKRSKKTRRG